MKRMGENISPLSFWDKMIDENPIIIKEGLITSYNGEMVLNAICDSFHLRKNGQTKISIEPLRGTEYIYIGDAYITKENEEEIIKVRLDANEDFIDIISLGGLVGINLCPAHLSSNYHADISDIIKHIEHYLSLGGDNILALGCDLDGTDLPGGFSGIEDIYKIAEEMARINYSNELINKIMYKNAFKFFESNL